MKSLLNTFVGISKRVIFFKKGISWCNHVLSFQQEKVTISQKEIQAYKNKWKKLSRYVSSKYVFALGAKLEESSLSNIAPEDIVHHYIEPILNPYPYRAYCEDKNNFARILPASYLPKEFLRRIDGSFYDKDYNLIDFSKMNDVLKELGRVHKRIIVKPSIDSSSGQGICFYDFDGENFVNVQNSEPFVKLFSDPNAKNFVVQEIFEQSDFMKTFCKTSINTMRIVTYKSVRDDRVHIPAMILRIGKDGSLVDNAHAGGSFVSIDPQTGVLGKFVSDQFGRRSAIFNGIDFSKSFFRVPNFDNILKFAKDVATRVPYHRLLALDVVVGQGGTPKILEYNVSYFGSWPFPFVGQTPFGKFTDEIIEYCSKKRKGLRRVSYSTMEIS